MSQQIEYQEKVIQTQLRTWISKNDNVTSLILKLYVIKMSLQPFMKDLIKEAEDKANQILDKKRQKRPVHRSEVQPPLVPISGTLAEPETKRSARRIHMRQSVGVKRVTAVTIDAQEECRRSDFARKMTPYPGQIPRMNLLVHADDQVADDRVPDNSVKDMLANNVSRLTDLLLGPLDDAILTDHKISREILLLHNKLQKTLDKFIIKHPEYQQYTSTSGDRFTTVHRCVLVSQSPPERGKKKKKSTPESP